MAASCFGNGATGPSRTKAARRDERLFTPGVAGGSACKDGKTGGTRPSPHSHGRSRRVRAPAPLAWPAPRRQRAPSTRALHIPARRAQAATPRRRCAAACSLISATPRKASPAAPRRTRCRRGPPPALRHVGAEFVVAACSRSPGALAGGRLAGAVRRDAQGQRAARVGVRARRRGARSKQPRARGRTRACADNHTCSATQLGGCGAG